MTTMYTGEEGKRIRIAMHQHFFESRRKSLVCIYVRLALGKEQE